MTERLLYVVDDDPVIRQVVSRTASTSGYKPRSFAEVPEFEAAFRAEAPELILLDIAIGDHDGLELLNRLARWGCRCPILMVSGFDERVIASTVRVGKSLGLTMLEPLHKPLSPADLRALLQSISRTALPIREDDLGRALTGLELVPFYQPKLRVSDRALVGVEALVRWNHPERGLLPPSEFLPLAEAGPHITPLTFYMIEKAMADCVTWRARGADISVAVNVSAKSLVMEDFAERVSEIVRRSGASSSNLTLEVTETSAMADTQAILAVLTRLRIKGFSLSMDDFGTGYSSLKELHRMPFSELKVDRSFVTDMCRDRDAYTITKAIVGLGATLGLKTVAEGVETEAVMTALADVGCDVAQGYLIGRPMPPAAFLDWLNARSGVPA